jgi:tetratricopeptide (TPR) repeat protein
LTLCYLEKAMPSDRAEQAWKLLQQGYRAQMEGEFDRAVDLYKNSLALYPTAEAHTFLGWTYHFQGRVEDAIAECKLAIEVDPEFGNPYNDIGAYLIALGHYDEAIPWLERAIEAPRYDPRHYPHFNLGRAYFAKGMITRARKCFEQALEIEPDYSLARQAVESLRRMVN